MEYVVIGLLVILLIGVFILNNKSDQIRKLKEGLAEAKIKEGLTKTDQELEKIREDRKLLEDEWEKLTNEN